jgi:hypothetical protein
LKQSEKRLVILKDLGYFCRIIINSMGRNSTGAMTTRQVLRIELSFLLTKGFIVKDNICNFNLSWSSGDNISVSSRYDEIEKSLQLAYTTTHKNTGEKKKYDYKIELTSVPSNLGKGEVIYFICPITGKKARILYKCYGSEIWKSRFAYKNRIYYQSQIGSGHNVYNDKYWALERSLKELKTKPKKEHYRGKPTRIIKRISALEEKKERFDFLRWTIIPKSLQKSIAEMGFKIGEFRG